MGRTRIAAQAGANLGWVAGEVPADQVQAELVQDQGGGLVFQKELERRPDQCPGFDVTAAEAGGKPGRHAHLVAGPCGCLDAEGAIDLPGDGNLRHLVTLDAPRSRHGQPGPRTAGLPA